jgi:hypothetical protein
MQDHIFWKKRSSFISLIEHFIYNLITFDEFETKFSILWWESIKESDTIKFELEKFKNRELSSESKNYCSYITAIFRQFEEVDDEICTIEESKNFVKYIYNKLVN